MPVSKDERIVGIQKLVVDRDREFGGSLAGLTVSSTWLSETAISPY